MTRPFVGLKMDASEAYAVAGLMSEFALEMKTARHLGPVLKFSHSIMAEEFDLHMAGMAGTEEGHNMFHHVYEWGEVGNNDEKLWRNVLRGGGATRMASWEWRASKKVVPVSAAAEEKGVKEIHVFVWKAPVMEYDTDITITPKRGETLTYFTENEKGDLKFVVGDVHVSNPGGPDVKGAFTQAFTRWWAGPGGAMAFNNSVRQTLENDLGKLPIEETVAPFRRARTKTFRMGAIASPERAEQRGRMMARQFLESRDRDYVAAAAARANFKYGEDDD